MISRCLSIMLATAISITSAPAQTKNGIDNWLSAGTLDRAVVHFEHQLAAQPDNEKRFALGSTQFLAAVEHLAQGFYRYGLSADFAGAMNVPFLRLPVPRNPNPETVTPAAIRSLLQRFYEDMEHVNTVLQDIDDMPFKTPISLGHIGFDIDGDGTSSEHERFHKLFTTYNRNAARALADDNQFTIAFDLADAHWLKGYCSLLMALLDAVLAHDWGRVYAQSAHLFFAKADTPMAALLRSGSDFREYQGFADAIAALHVMNLPVTDGERLARVRLNLKETIASSRKFWQVAIAETDDDREWLPNSQQTSITGTGLTAEMISGWHDFLNEAEQILDGNKLIPHWRIHDGRGVNLRAVLERADSFDPVLWVQGSAAIPFLESGEKTSPQTWARLSRLFQGDFIGFAIWIN